MIKKPLKTVLISIGAVIGAVLNMMLFSVGIYIIITASLYSYLDTIPILATKDFASIYVEENELVDYDIFLHPSEKFSSLNKIDLEIREKIADYMVDNNYKLKSGEHKFMWNNSSFEELIDDFEFEKMKQF